MMIFIAAHVSATATALIRLDQRIQTAMVANDVSVLRGSLADDFRFNHSDGTTERKLDVIKTAASKPRYYIRREVSQARAEVRGASGLVIGTLDVAVRPEASDPPATEAICYALQYVHVFRKRDGRWRLVRHETTKMISPEHACRLSS